MLRLPGAVHAELVGHAERALPHEGCGFCAGPLELDVVDHFFPMRNAAESSRRFVLDPQEMLDVEREIDEMGLMVKGVMHSHPTTPAYPSPTDVADSERYDPLGSWHTVIVSLASDEPTVRSFRIRDGEVSEHPVVIV